MRLIAFVLTVMITFTMFGMNVSDSVKVYFRVGQSRFDPTLGDNRMEMDRCLETLRTCEDIDSIVIMSFASPDGTSRANELLAQARCNTISNYILDNSGISRRLIHQHPGGVAWEGLRQLVEETPEVPAREKVLDILDHTPLWVFDKRGRIVGGRKSSLMSLDGGRPYNWMLRHLFPKLRNAVAIVVYSKVETPSETQEVEPVVETPESAEHVEMTEESPVENVVENVVPSSDEEEPLYTEDRFALKTNLLYYAALLPNLEVEWRVADRWSVAMEGACAWYSEGLRKYRLAFVTPEVRYRVLPRGFWHGLYVGVLIGPGLYDLENGGNGYRGEGVMTGASVGYSFPIARRLSLEAGLAVGYVYTRYKEYRPLDGHFLYQQTKNLNYFGPLRLRLSLVWQFGHKRIATKKRSAS